MQTVAETSLFVKQATALFRDDERGDLIGRTKGWLITKLHAITDAKGRPLRFFMTAGQLSDYTGAVLGGLPSAEWLLALKSAKAT